LAGGVGFGVTAGDEPFLAEIFDMLDPGRRSMIKLTITSQLPHKDEF
jgi:hypothetical protein